MSVEGVMVAYHLSGQVEPANITTVSASGIMFSSRWVLTHGSILHPLKESHVVTKSRRAILSDAFYDKLPEIYITCETETDERCDAVARLASERDDAREHESCRIRVATGRICHIWQCPVVHRCVSDILYSWTVGNKPEDSADKQSELGKALMSVFVLIDLECDVTGLKALRPLSELYDMVRPAPDRGTSLEVHSTPFGCEVFLNAVTRGSVCGVVGKKPSMLLTDASTGLGSEGGPVFTYGTNTSRALIGCVVCSVAWCRGEWVGLTLVAPLSAVLAAKLRIDIPKRVPAPATYRDVLNQIDSTTLLVRCGMAWGAGVYLGGGYVVTCSHVVKNSSTTKLSLYCQGVKETAIVRYKTADDKAYDLALLYSNPENWSHLRAATFAKEPVRKGESVLAAGYPFYNENMLDDLKPTVTTGHVNNVSPSMIQSSCCVQSGFSGGAIYRLGGETHSLKLEAVGIIVCNAKTQEGACYPYINMAVPAQAFHELFSDYMHDKGLTIELGTHLDLTSFVGEINKGVQYYTICDKDEMKLRPLENKNEMIQSQWRLMPYKSKI